MYEPKFKKTKLKDGADVFLEYYEGLSIIQAGGQHRKQPLVGLVVLQASSPVCHLAWRNHGEANSSELNSKAACTVPPLQPEKPTVCASLTHRATARPQKANHIGIANFPTLAIITLTVAQDICSAVSLIG